MDTERSPVARKRLSLLATASVAAITLGLSAMPAFGLARGNFEQAKLVASDADLGTFFGTAVSISGDTAIVGAERKNADAGMAYVFVRTGTTWTQQAEFGASDGGPSEFFGSTVSISGDTAVVGALQHNTNFGEAYVFVRSGTTWTEQAKLNASDAGPFNYFGASVAVSGSTAVVGAYGNTAFAGAAYVFVRSGTTWSQRPKLTASDKAGGDRFGWSVAISGSTLVVGADAKDSNTGAAYAFVSTGSTWTEQAKLTASDGAPNRSFGDDVAISGDNALVGAPSVNPGSGDAYVFNRSGTTWTQAPKLSASDAAADDHFGTSVSISGSRAVVGADGKNGYTGGAYVFTSSGTLWSQALALTASDGVCCDQYGNAAAISGSTAVVGAIVHGGGAGEAYVYDLSGIVLQSAPASPPPRSGGANQSGSGTPQPRTPAMIRRAGE